MGSRWKEFPILRVAAHGKKVKCGDELLSIDTARLDRKIHSLKRIVARNQKRLIRKRNELKTWRTTSLSQLERLLEIAVSTKEAEEHFRRHVRIEKKHTATQAIERTGLMLARQIQEYRMIFSLEKSKKSATSLSSRALEYHQGVMAASEFCLGMEVLNHRKIIDSQLPQEARSLAGAAEEARRRYAAALVTYTQHTHAAQLYHIQHEARLWQQCETLAALETDRSLCLLHAPADGWFHHLSTLEQATVSHQLTEGHCLRSGEIFASFTPEARMAFQHSPA